MLMSDDEPVITIPVPILQSVWDEAREEIANSARYGTARSCVVAKSINKVLGAKDGDVAVAAYSVSYDIEGDHIGIGSAEQAPVVSDFDRIGETGDKYNRAVHVAPDVVINIPVPIRYLEAIGKTPADFDGLTVEEAIRRLKGEQS